MIDKQIENITFKFENINEFEKLKKLNEIDGITDVSSFNQGKDLLTFKLKNKEKLIISF